MINQNCYTISRTCIAEAGLKTIVAIVYKIHTISTIYVLQLLLLLCEKYIQIKLYIQFSVAVTFTNNQTIYRINRQLAIKLLKC